MGNTEKEELIEAVLQYGLEELEYASNELLGDREFIAELVRVYDGDYQDVLEYASEEIQADSKFITRLASMEKSTEEQPTIVDEEFDLPEVEDITSAQELEFLKMDDQARGDKDYIIELISKGILEALEYATEDVRMDPEVILEAVIEDWAAIKYASDQLKSDEDFIQQLFELGKISDEQILEFASEELKEDIEFFFELRDRGVNLGNKKIFDLRELRGDSDFIFGLLREGHIEALEWASDSLIEDRRFFPELAFRVPQIHNELWETIILQEYGRGDIAKDKKIVLDVISYYGLHQLEGASEELLGNKDFILELLDNKYLVQDNEDVSTVCSLVNRELLEDKDFILSAIQLYGDSEFKTAILEHVGEEVLEDKEFMLQLIDESGGHILRYAGEKLQGDREFVLAAINDDGTALEFASEELRGDKEIVLEAVKEIDDAVTFASDELKQNDPQIKKLVELVNERDSKIEEMWSKWYSYNQIADAIAPTESMIKAVQAEMIEEMEKATEPEKDTQGQDLE